MTLNEASSADISLDTDDTDRRDWNVRPSGGAPAPGGSGGDGGRDLPEFEEWARKPSGKLGMPNPRPPGPKGFGAATLWANRPPLDGRRASERALEVIASALASCAARSGSWADPAASDAGDPWEDTE